MDMSAVQEEVEGMAKEIMKEPEPKPEQEEEEDYGPQDVQAMIETLTFIWNHMGEEEIDVGSIMERIRSAIPTQFEEDKVVSDGGEDEEDVEEEVVVQKRIYLCGECKKRGQQVPKKGHDCPHKST